MPHHKDSYWFPHDCNARSDSKILALRSVYKSEGYGWYWIIIEMLREESTHKLPLNGMTPDAFAMQMQCDRNAVEKFLHDCMETFVDSDGKSLLQTDGKSIWSDSLLRRLEGWDRKSEQAKQAAKMRWQCGRNADADADAMRTEMRMQCNKKTVHKKIIDKPPISPNGFDVFWGDYPKKVAKQDAIKAFKKVNPDDSLLTKMLQALKVHKGSIQWQQGFIPDASKWLNGKRWEDVIEAKSEEIRPYTGR